MQRLYRLHSLQYCYNEPCPNCSCSSVSPMDEKCTRGCVNVALGEISHVKHFVTSTQASASCAFKKNSLCSYNHSMSLIEACRLRSSTELVSLCFWCGAAHFQIFEKSLKSNLNEIEPSNHHNLAATLCREIETIAFLTDATTAPDPISGTVQEESLSAQRGCECYGCRHMRARLCVLWGARLTNILPRPDQSWGPHCSLCSLGVHTQQVFGDCPPTTCKERPLQT